MAKVNLSEDIKKKQWVTKNIYFHEIIFVCVFVMLAFLLYGRNLSGVLQWIYHLFSVLVGSWFISKCPVNPSRKNWQELIIFIQRNDSIYRPIGYHKESVINDEIREKSVKKKPEKNCRRTYSNHRL